jgi:sRNA-binding carbon storage regulator CsrA
MGFLVISRRLCEGIEITDGHNVVVIRISDINGGMVDVAVKAPREFEINRLSREMEEQPNESRYPDRSRH